MKMARMGEEDARMIRSAHVDSFARDNLPPVELQPTFLFDLPDVRYPERFNCVTAFVDDWVARGDGARDCLIAPTERFSYAQLAERVNRIANVLTRDLNIVPGNRVLLRGPNSPMMVAAYFAVIKAGGVVVATMPLLRAKEIAFPITKAEIKLALCDVRLADEMEKTRPLAPMLERVVYWGSGGADSLQKLMQKPGYENFTACDTASDDVCLIAFTSGTTGVPKGTMHFHRDMLAICDTFGKHTLRARADDRFIGSPPIAFTFGLGGLVLFPLRIGAAAVLLEKAAPDDLLAAISQFRATVCFTAPTAYRAMLGSLKHHDLSSLRKCVSAGETLPAATFEAWAKATGIRIIDGLGSTEMLHVFIGCREEDMRAGATGRPVAGYEARVIDAHGNDAAAGVPGRLAVRGPTGCRYLGDERQSEYVQSGWNVTGDTYIKDADGYFRYLARSDDMIISAGYNIAGPEVETVLLTHPAVAECGVVGAPDADRGSIVKAYVVLRSGFSGDAALTNALQEHVKTTVAPYKYPRAIEYVTTLPRTETGKLQRFELRRIAADSAASKLAS
jgi:2-aminobenzoate-CoA ligase